jgi:two-component system, cell cycle sensor histidine kinase and response regulator CckA
MHDESRSQFDPDARQLIGELERQRKDLEAQLEALRGELAQSTAREQALREREENYQTVLENSSIGVCIVGLDGKFISVNETMCAITGYTKPELYEMTFSSITYPEDLKIGASLYEELVTGVRPKGSVEKRYTHKDGHTIWASISVSLLSGNRLEPPRFVTHIQDITDRKHAEEERLKTEALIRTAVENLPLIFYLIGRDGKFKLSTGAGLKALGLQPNQVVGLSVFDVYKDFPHLIKAIERALAGEPVNFESHVAGATFLNYCVSYTNIDGTFSGVAAVALDITERKQAEEALQASEGRMQFALEGSNDGLWDVDMLSGTPYLSPRGCEILGYRSDDLAEIVRVWDQLVHPDDLPVTLERLNDHLEGRAPLFSVEQRLRMKSGDWKWILTRGKVTTRDADGKALRMTGTHTDITERKQAEEALSVQKNLLLQAQKVQSIGTLAGGIAHDFNNILGIILGYVSMLEARRTDPQKHAECVNVISDAVDRGAALVQQILTFARKTDVQLEQLNISSFIGEMIGMLKETFPKTITFRENYGSNEPAVVGDRSQLHQAILNLCVNARDAMPNGGSIGITTELLPNAQVRQRFPAASDETYIRINVSDTGMGMDEATRLRVFDPFFTTKDKGKGTGLGLSVVYGVMQSHHGFVDVESHKGSGTVFSLYLPVTQATEASVPGMESAAPAVAGGTETILVVEDEEQLMEMLSLALRSKGYTVIMAEDGQEAIDRFRQDRSRIDAVITDIGLPIISGIDVFKQLKEIDPKLKGILASGFFEPGRREELEMIGARGFINKPYRTNDVLRMLRQVLDEDDAAN